MSNGGSNKLIPPVGGEEVFGIIFQLKRRVSIMAKPIQWETSLTTVKAKSKKEKKLILMDFYNNL
jgi:hypothetical protein